MKDASQYPVTFGYGATDGYYYGPNGTVGKYHRGDDRGMPIGTPVVVSGVQIGLSGSMYGGPHLHTGRFVNGKDTDPQGGGFSLSTSRVLDTGQDDVNGKYVRLVDQAGVVWVYLHLSRIDAVKNQVIQEAPPVSKESLTKEEVIVTHQLAYFQDPPQSTIDYYTGKDLSTMLTDFKNSDPRKEVERQYEAGANGTPPPEDVTILGPGKYEFKA